MLFIFRFTATVGKLVVQSNVCLATIESSDTRDGWTVGALTLMEDDPSVSFSDRHMEHLPKTHWLWPVVSADLLKKHKSEIAAKWQQSQRVRPTLVTEAHHAVA